MFKFPLFPASASVRAPYYDAIFFTISGLTVFFTLVVGALILTFVMRYRAGSKASRAGATDHNSIVEISAIIPMFILAMGIFAWSASNFVTYRKTPKPGEGTEVFVIGKQWMWHMQHLNGIRENNELHIPVNKPVTLTMISQDVIHAMYLPEMRAQYHVVPGRYTRLTFTPNKVGKYRMLCNMYCGTQHSEMVGQVFVLSQKDYDEWLRKGGNRYQETPMTMTEAGKQLFTQKGCANCHTDRDNLRGPTLNGIYNTNRTMTDGSVLKADDEYLRDSILNPWRVLTKGYNDQTMPAYKNELTEEQVLQLITYIKGQTSLPMQPGEKMPAYQRPDVTTEGGPGGKVNATDRANMNGSAIKTQFDMSENRR